MDKSSLFKLSGLPDPFGVVLLSFSFILLLAPYFSGADFGLFKIPTFTLGAKKWLKVIGPVIFLTCMLSFIPMFTVNKEAEVKAPPTSTSTSSPTPQKNDIVVETLSSPSPPPSPSPSLLSPSPIGSVLQEGSFLLPVEGFSSSCADPNNTDKQGYTNPNCTWFTTFLTPKGESSEFQVSLKLTVNMTNTSLDGGGCNDPHRQAEVSLKYGDQSESRSGLIGKTNVNEATQEYSLTGQFSTSKKPVPIKVFINPRGCTKVTLNSGELKFKEIRR